jgi:23S rRNA (guanosine2251-2'-O)-methyltransferase
MTSKQFVIQCLRPNCRFRYLTSISENTNLKCIKCGAATSIIPFFPENRPINHDVFPNNHHLEVLCDNIRSSYNIGAIFRTADGVGIKHIHLCGITPAPDHPNVQKTALGAERNVPWTQSWNACDTVLNLKMHKNYSVFALENSKSSISIFDIHPTPSEPILLIIGNEISGIDPELLDMSNIHLYIPMVGSKNSLNVSVALGIAAYTLIFR